VIAEPIGKAAAKTTGKDGGIRIHEKVAKGEIDLEIEKACRHENMT